jgi:hypothetical protein
VGECSAWPAGRRRFYQWDVGRVHFLGIDTEAFYGSDEALKVNSSIRRTLNG